MSLDLPWLVQSTANNKRELAEIAAAEGFSGVGVSGHLRPTIGQEADLRTIGVKLRKMLDAENDTWRARAR